MMSQRPVCSCSRDSFVNNCFIKNKIELEMTRPRGVGANAVWLPLIEWLYGSFFLVKNKYVQH